MVEALLIAKLAAPTFLALAFEDRSVGTPVRPPRVALFAEEAVDVDVGDRGPGCCSKAPEHLSGASDRRAWEEG